MPPPIHRLFQPSPVIRYCYQCFLPQSTAVQLKLCSGCRVAEYCSKECQKAAWPTHRKLCRVTCTLASNNADTGLDDALRAFGFKSPLEHLEVFNEFTQAHKWALEAHFHVAIRRKVGFAPALGDITDSILVGDLECVLPPPTQTRKHLDPASRFRLREDRFKFTPLAEFNNAVPGRTETFDRLYGESRTLVQEIHGWHPLFLGGCPVVYLIWPLGFVTYTCCSIFSPIRIPRPPDPMSDESMRHEILEDKLRLATASINSGIVLRAVDLHGQPVPGRFVRADKMWSFHPLFKAEPWPDAWDAYLMAEPRPEGADLLDDAIARCTSGLELVELIYVSQML